MSDAIFSTAMDDGVAVVTFDLPGTPVNIFSRAVREAVPPLFARLRGDPAVRAVVFASGKPDTWIAGADAEELATVTSAAEAERLSLAGHVLLDDLAQGTLPVVAAIHGACLGGGLEFAMACTYRLASDHRKTVLGLPEVQLGLLPGGGGTQRLPRLVGLATALDLMLAGKTVPARKANAIGLVDEVVHPAILRAVAVRRARELADRSRPRPRPRGAQGMARLLEATVPGRALVFRQARAQVLAKTGGHYPAPLGILDAVAAGYGSPGAGYALEARRFGELTQTPVAHELSFLFFATTALKKDPGVDGDPPPPRPVTRIAILGAGFMGAGIAAATVPQGIAVGLKDTDPARVLAGLRTVRDIVRERQAKRRLTPREAADQLALVRPGTTLDVVRGAPLVIEAVF